MTYQKPLALCAVCAMALLSLLQLFGLAPSWIAFLLGVAMFFVWKIQERASFADCGLDFAPVGAYLSRRAVLLAFLRSIAVQITAPFGLALLPRLFRCHGAEKFPPISLQRHHSLCPANHHHGLWGRAGLAWLFPKAAGCADALPGRFGGGGSLLFSGACQQRRALRHGL